MVHLTLALSVLIALNSLRRNDVFLKIAFFTLFLFASLRYMYGNDYYAYYKNYVYIQSGGTSPYEGEFLFTLLNRFCPSFYVLIAITSFLFIYVIYRLIIDNLPLQQAWIGLLIFVVNPYLFLMNLSAIRQCLAMLLFIVAVKYGIERKVIPYILLIVIAAMFHKSAWLLLPVYLILNPKPIKARHCIIITICVLILLFGIDLQPILASMAELFDDAGYSYYVTNITTNTLRATLLTAIFFIYVLINLYNLRGTSLAYAKLFLISTILGVLAYRFSMFTRIQMYFEIFSVVALPAIFCQNQTSLIEFEPEHGLLTFGKCISKYLFPILMLLIYFLRYWSFFANPMWEAFVTYHSIIGVV